MEKMTWIARIAAGVASVIGVGFGFAQAQAPAPVPTISVEPYLIAASTTTVAPLPIPDTAKCPEWWPLAREIGWPEEALTGLDRIMFRESRCNPAANNKLDPNRAGSVKGSLGLTQINAFWVMPTASYPAGYLQTVGAVTKPRDLFDPAANLKAALAIFDYSRNAGRCGFSAWSYMDCKD